MGYLESEEKIELELEVYRNQRLSIVFIFLYLIGIIVLVSVSININRGILNLLYVIIAPISSVGWLYFTNKLYELKASVYNRFGSKGLYHWLSVFWGNKQLPVVALLLSLILAGSSFINFFILENSIGKDLKNAQQNVQQLRDTNDKAFKELEKLQQLTDGLEKKNLSASQQEELKKVNEKLNNIKNQLSKTLKNTK
jgi:hypothetical protein